MEGNVYEARIDLRQGAHTLVWDTHADVGNAWAHTFVLTFLDHTGEPLLLDGYTLGLYCIRPDGHTVYQVGSVQGDRGWVTLDPACYLCPGRIKITIVLSRGQRIVSMAKIWITIGRMRLDGDPDPAEAVPTLDELQGEVQNLQNLLQIWRQARAEVVQEDPQLPARVELLDEDGHLLFRFYNVKGKPGHGQGVDGAYVDPEGYLQLTSQGEPTGPRLGPFLCLHDGSDGDVQFGGTVRAQSFETKMGPGPFWWQLDEEGAPVLVCLKGEGDV